jgi:hypothetical protein
MANRKPRIKPPKPMKRPASAPPTRHPKTGRFTKQGIGTPQQIQPPLGPTLAP